MLATMLVVAKLKESRNPNDGYNAETGQYGDMMAMGIIDPAKVTRLALQNAAPIASLMITPEALVCEIPEEENKNAHLAGERILAELRKRERSLLLLDNVTDPVLIAP